ncbi:hypothetical protein BJY04DRAFT_191015 [Aspergillus karnatakaensis]|uniref:uncharacterized protein n=1 Tax=Aspergillus karnatakaensis TaxID=1810916 RepID=UPI003CCCDC2B
MASHEQTQTSALSSYNLAKEREFYRYLPHNHNTYPYAPADDDTTDSFVAQPSQDRALNAFAQLGAMRLGARRGMITLLSPTYQYILAEATGTPNPKDDLWLGCCILPREHSVCKHVMKLPLSESSDDPEIVDGSAIVIPDMKNSQRIQTDSLAKRLSPAQFYAGVPIVAPSGITIGTYCIFDTETRRGLDEASLDFMHEMGETVMQYLEMVQSKHQNAQAKKMIFGLGSFVEGKSTLRDSWLESNEQEAATGRSGKTVEGQLNRKQQDLQEARDHPSPRQLPYRPSKRGYSNESQLTRTPDLETPPNLESPTLETPSSDTARQADVPLETPALDATLADHNQLKEEHLNRDDNLDSEKNEEQEEPTEQDEKDEQAEEKKESHGRATFRSSVSDDNLRDDNSPAGFQKIFSRAANLIRESIGVEGVAFLDARIESFGGLVGSGQDKSRAAYARDETASSEDSTDSGSGDGTPVPAPKNEENTKNILARTLGSSTSLSSTINDDTRIDSNLDHDFGVRESVLKAILDRYPHGKIFTCDENGLLSDDSTTGSVSSMSTESENKSKTRRRKPHHRQETSDLIKVLEGARSVIFLPVWDSHQSRWLSGLLVWTRSPERVFSAENELAYLRAFSNSVTAEVHRLDVEMAEKAKSNLVSSISHELRSPLHGILGTADIVSDTAMNALQQGMLHTIESCGRTLLDTIDHLLDFSYIDKFKKDYKPKHRHRHGENSHAPVQLDVVLEEVVESVFAGHTFYHHTREQPRQVSGEKGSRTIVLPTKQVTVILDIQEAAEWNFFTQAGCWRRIFMNLFGNALKYTPSGFIYLELKAAEVPRRDSTDSETSSQYTVTFKIKDTGQGIDVNYLRNGLFTPFSQEDSLAPGSGLGLSIVRQALSALRGSIEVSSEKGKGTEITIEVPVRPGAIPEASDKESASSAAYSPIRKQAQGKTIGLVGFGPSVEGEQEGTLFNSLKRLCEDWFHLTVKRVSLQGDTPDCDFYLMVHTDMNDPAAEKNQLLRLDQPGKLSPLMVICQSPEIAHNMIARASSRNHESIVEFISQPCGPRKLAKTLELCLNRLEGREPHAGEETRWVEMPESSHLPLDIGPRDAPNERMKISKRPLDQGTEPRDREHKHKEQDTPPASKSSSPVSAEPKQTRPHVLLVEDNPVNLNILVAYVKKDGWSYKTATNGLEAVETFQANPGMFEMVIIDISMPVLNGFEASQQIRHHEREYFDKHPEQRPPWYPVTIVALTGLDSAAAQQEAYSSGIDTFLTKPISRQKVRALLDMIKKK